MLGPRRSAPVLPRKTVLCGKGFLAFAQIRTGPRRICRGNRGPCQVCGLMLGFVQLRAGFAKNTVLRAGSWAKCLGPRRVCAPDLPKKPCSVLGFSAKARLRFSRKNRAWFLSSMLGSAQVRARFARENPAPRCVVVLYRDSTRSALWKFAEFAIS